MDERATSSSVASSERIRTALERARRRGYMCRRSGSNKKVPGPARTQPMVNRMPDRLMASSKLVCVYMIDGASCAPLTQFASMKDLRSTYMAQRPTPHAGRDRALTSSPRRAPLEHRAGKAEAAAAAQLKLEQLRPDGPDAG